MNTLRHATRFNEQDYQFEIYLDNGLSQNASQRFYINPNAIVNLNIENSLSDWVVKGTLSIFYSFDVIENEPSRNSGDGGPASLANYVFRNDGNDILNIRIFPNLESLGLPVDRVHWEISHRFAIYDVEDIDLPPGAQNAASASTKCKKFYFWDHWYQKMITNTMEYSTALSPSAPGGGAENLSDEARSIPTGIAIKEIIEKALIEEDVGSTPVGGVVIGGSSEWESGATSLFYTAPAFATAYDSLMYMYEKHVSETSNNNLHDYSVLLKERGPNEGGEGYFTLRPLSYYFDKAGTSTPGEFQIEHFYVQDYSNQEPRQAAALSRRAPFSQQQNLQIDTKLDSYSLISSYRFVDISPYTNATKFCTRPVYSFDFKNRTYKIEFQQNSATSTRDFVAEKYISKVLTESGDKKNLFLITLDQKKKGRNVKPVYALEGGIEPDKIIQRQTNGLQELLRTGLFQNTAINFRTLGATKRQPGRFIAIDSRNNVEDNTFNNKLYGQWFVIEVKSVFEGGMYYDDITAVRLHKFKAGSANFPNTL
jgi:hypothetical protein